MKFAHFFVDHPVFAAVISILITLVRIVVSWVTRLPVSTLASDARPEIGEVT